MKDTEREQNKRRIMVRRKREYVRYYEGEGHAVAQLVEALRYKSAGRGFDSPWC